jgi:hypothetical protein
MISNKMKGSLAAVALASAVLGTIGADALSRKPISLGDVQYTGYTAEKADGALYLFFADSTGKRKVVRNLDKSFNPDLAYRLAQQKTNLTFDVKGYNSLLYGSVATNVVPSKR